VNHDEKEYARCTAESVIATSAIEGYFSIFKRGTRGIYRHCGGKHLHRYLAEFDFRCDTRVALGGNDAMRA
jgi:ISXO2-like transposase domain